MTDNIFTMHQKNINFDGVGYSIIIRHVKQKAYSEEIGYHVFAGHPCNGRIAKYYSPDFADVAGFIIACEGVIARYHEQLKTGKDDLTTALLKDGFNKIEFDI